jgi:hypothetical protein
MGGGKLTRARLGALAMVACLAIASSGCGGGDERVSSAAMSNGSALSLLTQADVKATPANSPQRTIMTWWRLTQYKSVQDSLREFTPAARRLLIRAGYEALIVRWFGPWLRNGRPRIERVDTDGGHAIAYMLTTFNAPVGADLVRHDVDSLAIALDRRNGRWLISDPSWVIQQATTLRLAEDRAQQAAQPAQPRAAR